jgi:fucose permease
MALFGINTFTEGYGGRFGDIGGGVVLDPAWGWISETTGLTLIPETGTLLLLLVGFTALYGFRRRVH